MPSAFAFPDAVPTLSGPRVCLRALCEADIPAWFARASDAESAFLAGDPIPDSIAQGGQWLHRHRERFRQKSAIRWAIVPAGQSQSIGTIGLTLNPGAPHTAELGFVIARTHWNQGFGTAAACLVIAYAFGPLALAGLHAEVFTRNHPSRRILGKHGFRIDRIFPATAQSEAYEIQILRRPAR